jgi:hypothetical protein
MRNLDEKKIDCPYCGECIDIFIEPIFNDVGQSDSYEETKYNYCSSRRRAWIKRHSN